MDPTRGLKLRTYEYYFVDPATWLDAGRATGITGGSMAWNLEDDQLGSATFLADADAGLDDRYVRVYMVIEQDGVRERFALGTWLVECPEEQFDGARESVEATGYTPLRELADVKMPPGYPCAGDAAVNAAAVMSGRMRAPVLALGISARLDGSFAAGADESALDYCLSMLSAADLRPMLDGMGRVSFAPVRDAASMRPVWTFRDDDASVLLPDLSHKSGLRDVRNVARVVYSTATGRLVGEAVNDDPASPASTVSRGRELTLVVTSPDLPENPTQVQVDALAARLLREDSASTHEFKFSHGFVPDVTVGCAVELDYTRAGKHAVALVTEQHMEFDEAATVECRAVFSEQVWG